MWLWLLHYVLYIVILSLKPSCGWSNTKSIALVDSDDDNETDIYLDAPTAMESLDMIPMGAASEIFEKDLAASTAQPLHTGSPSSL